MRANVVAVIFVTATSLGVATATEAFDGNVFFDMCSSNDPYLSNGCTGMAMGVFSGLAFANSAPPGYGLPDKFCIPSGVGIEQWQDVLVQYVKNHPGQRHYELGALAYFALTETFPC